MRRHPVARRRQCVDELTTATVKLTVKPGSKCPGWDRIDGDWVVRVRERAIDGAANEACVRALADALGLATAQVALVRGHRARVKTFAVGVLDDAQIRERLGAIAAETGYVRRSHSRPPS